MKTEGSVWKEVAMAHRRSSIDEGPSKRCCLSAYVVLCVSRNRAGLLFISTMFYQQHRFYIVKVGGVENGALGKLW
jgi:hypothetical protein